MRKQALVVEWTIAKNDADWERLRGPLLPDNEPTANRRRPLQRHLWSVAALLLLLAGAGEWWRRSTAASLQAAAAELRTTVQQKPLAMVMPGREVLVTSIMNERTNVDRWPQYGFEDFGVSAFVQTADPDEHLDIPFDTVDVQGDQAVATVIISAQNGASAYRQTRFYRHIAADWLRTEPDAALWGPERSLETPYIVFHFRQNDASAVIAVAPQIDALYTAIWGNFGLPIIPTPEKLVIEVSVTQNPGNALFQHHNDDRFIMDDRLIVASPAVYLAPVELTDAELLAQSIALPLLEYGLAQASEHHAIGSTWQPMWSGLYLWQLWDLDLPLSAWREDVVTWLYVGLPATRPGQAVVLPDQYEELCAVHTLWMLSPAEIHIPLLCAELDRRDWYISGWRVADFPTHLDQLVVPLRPGEYSEELDSLHRVPPHPDQTVALATLIEYAVATYGRERLPALVAGLGQYNTWDSLLLAVYGVSPVEFEAGWQAHLAGQYGVSVEHKRDSE